MKRYVKNNVTKTTKRITAASDIENVKIHVPSNCYVDVYEDDYEKGEGALVNSYQFSIKGNDFESAEDLIQAIADAGYGFSDRVSEYYFMDGHLSSSISVDIDGDPADPADVEKFQNGEVQWFIADLYLALECVSDKHEMTEDEAANFGFELY